MMSSELECYKKIIVWSYIDSLVDRACMHIKETGGRKNGRLGNYNSKVCWWKCPRVGIAKVLKTS